MHLNSGRINRPSLLSDGMQIKDAEPTSGRILADMEGLPAKKTPRATSGSLLQRYPIKWMASAAVLAIIAGVFFWDFSQDAQLVATQGAAESLPKTLTIAPTVKPDIKPDAVPSEGTALIVNAPAEVPASSQAAAQPAPVSMTPPTVDAPVAAKPTVAARAVATKPAAPPVAKFARVAPPKAAPRAAASRPRPKAATRSAAAAEKAKSDETLLVTLLGIINEEDKAAGASSPQTIDDLIARIEGDQQPRRPVAQRGTAQAGERKPASTQSNIQAQLRRCPSANTLQGVECRSRICAGLDSKDPACPAG